MITSLGEPVRQADTVTGNRPRMCKTFLKHQDPRTNNGKHYLLVSEVSECLLARCISVYSFLQTEAPRSHAWVWLHLLFRVSEARRLPWRMRVLWQCAFGPNSCVCCVSNFRPLYRHSIAFVQGMSQFQTLWSGTDWRKICNACVCLPQHEVRWQELIVWG